MDMNEKALKVIEILDKVYPDAKCSLEFDDPLQLLIATQLAAQCTDERVNKVTPHLFETYKDAKEFANAIQDELEKIIMSTGFFRNKAKNIIACCKMIIEQHSGEVPRTMEELLKLPGVGRKTANLVLGDIFGVPGIVVDTHAKRLSKRIGFTKNEDPEKVEYDLMKIIPVEKWTDFCHKLVYHGRAVCIARKPKCDICPINMLCDYVNLG